MRRYAANIGMLWSHLSLLERMEAAARAGFRAIEMHFPYNVPPLAVRRASERFGLQLLGINSPPGNLARGELGLAAIPGREIEFVHSFRLALDYCETAGAESIHVMAGNVCGYSQQACLEAFRRNLIWAANLASSRNIKLLLEPLNWRRHPAYFYHDVAELSDILAWIAHPWLKIQFDTYHVGMQGGNVLEVMTRHWPLIGHIQVAAVPDRGEPNYGDVDIAKILHEAETLSYSGWIGCEYLPRNDVENGLAWMQASGFVENE